MLEDSSGKQVIAMILGITSVLVPSLVTFLSSGSGDYLILFFGYGLAAIFAIAGLVLGIIGVNQAKKNEERKAKGVVAIVLSIVAIIEAIAFTVLFGFALLFLNGLENGENVLPKEISSKIETFSDETIAPNTQKRKAPDITVYDGLGNKRSLSDFKGKPVVVNFWASWCGYCKREMPYFEEAYKKYGEDVQFMMVDICDGRAETQASGSALIRGEGYTFPVFFDHDQDASAKYPLSGIPKTYLIDSEGYIVYECPGAIKEDYLDQTIPNLK